MTPTWASVVVGAVAAAGTTVAALLAAPGDGDVAGAVCKYTPWHVDGRQNGGLEFVDPASNPNGEPVGDGTHYLVECDDGYRDVLWLRGELSRAVTAVQLAHQ